MSLLQRRVHRACGDGVGRTMSAELQQRLLARPTAALKVKLVEKTKYLPTALVVKRLPPGCHAIARLPELHESAEALRSTLDCYDGATRRDKMSDTRNRGVLHKVLLKQQVPTDQEQWLVHGMWRHCLDKC